MVAQSSIFPIFLRSEYREDANGIPKFISRIQQAAKISEAELKRVGTAMNAALASPRTGSGSLDLGTGQLREQIRAQDQAAIAAREVANATKAVAIANGELRTALLPTVRAYFDSAKAKEAEVAASRAQLAALEAVQAQISQTASATTVLVGENLRLAQAEAGAANGATMLTAIYRGTAAEIGRVANSARESASAFELLFQAQDARTSTAAQAFFNTALGIDRQTKSARESALAMQELFAAQERAELSARQITGAYLALAQAEAAAVNGGNMIAATLRGTALEADRATNSARESAQVFQQMFVEQEQAALKAKAAQDALNASVAALRAQINPAAAAQDQFNQRVAFAQAALDRGELSQKEYARAVQLASAELREAGRAEIAATAARNGFTTASRRGTTAQGNVINSARSSRTAFIQLGQQMQDVTVQAQMGTNAFIIFGQQVPQAAFALSGLADSANRTQAAVGRFATFMAGPFGALIFVGIAVLGPLIQKLLETGEEADAARDKTFNFADGLDVLKLSAEDATTAMDQLASSLRSAITLQGDFLRGEVAIARQSAERLQAQITADQAELTRLQQQFSGAGANLLPSVFGPSGDDIRRQGALQERLRANRAKLGPALEAAGVAAVAEANRNIAEASDPLLKQINAIDDAIARLNRRREQTVINDDPLAEGGVSQADFERQLSNLAQQRAALEAQQREARRSGRSASGRSGAARAVREAQQLATFGAQAAEQILRINERFDEQTRLVDQAAQATRQLDDIIAELSERKPAGFEELVEQAEAAKITVEEALLRPFELLREESENRLAIEQALAQGRVDEAAALQEIFRIEQQLRPLTEEQRDDIRDIVLFEQQRIRYLRDQQALLEAQMDVVSTVRRDLQDILSGRPTDFIKNFRQALLDLQGARLFEDLFGDSFRAIEEELRGNTPQGRANAAFTAEVNKAGATTKTLEESLFSLATAVTGVTSQIAAAATGAANDNLPTTIGGEIVVARNRAAEVLIKRASINELAERIARGTTEPFENILSDVFGNGFAGLLGDVVSGAIKGAVLGGNAGAVFGGIEGILSTGILGNDNRLTAIAGAGVDGAARGSQIAALSKALGLGGSTSGSQIGGGIGGAVGAAFGIPGLDIAGAIVGNFLGKLLKGTPRASATIGGIGGSLGVTGTRGNSSSRGEAAGGLAQGVLDAIDQIAEQLGASVDASRGSVSIGVRNDDLRVDTTGRGITKTRNGAIDFGDDSEAAIAFAVQDLINDGVITGLRASENNLLRAGKDIEDALRDVLTFRSVFDRLEEIRDPLGFAIGQLNREFEGLIDLFERAGASTEEFADLEELYNLERARVIEDATDRVASSLRQLLNDLTIGDSGLSLRSRRANALGQFNDLAGRVAAGDSTAFDDFADISQQLLDIERQLFGSTQSYFDRLAQITALTEQAIASETNVTSIGSNAPSPFADRVEINRSIDTMNADVTGWLRAINDNLIALNGDARFVSGGGDLSARGGIFPNQVLNF